MSSLSQALRLEYLPSSHSAFQGHAAHIIEWAMMLRPKDSEGTCIPSGVPTFLQTASRRNPTVDQLVMTNVVDNFYDVFAKRGKMGAVTVQRTALQLPMPLSEHGLAYHLASARGEERKEILLDFAWTAQ